MKTEKIKGLLTDKSLTIPGFLLSNYKTFNLDFKELVFLSVVLSELDNFLFDAPYIAKRLGLEVFEVMEIISSLCDKKLIEIKVEKIDGKSSEIISLDAIFSKILLDKLEEIEEPNVSEIYTIIEKELGRTLSPIEYETISEWISGGISEELIHEALKEAVLNGVSSLKYIDKILSEWTRKGYKTKNDVKKKNKKQKETEIFDIDWLDLDE